ncbi:heterokaryon incompatibility protein [Stemphylium lycopersici]|uniref:Heterokaryon incompatibility protein n=1 Tax=Stemphylium lycopersici TaxID=183478 RepID=A0A364N1Q4_STELY|nr:heterokaryon incompatibility protein [Stemphylium lycopersici]
MQQPKPTPFPPSRSSNDFQYRPLNHADGEDFRILCLYPGELHEPIRCDLLHSSLDADIEYEALSYSWATEDGDDSLSQRIECAYVGDEETAEFLVTSNCASALRRLRLASQERFLWVDAISIDHKSVQERSHQVGLMAEIYSGASQVLVYLGEEDLGFASRSLWLDSERRQSALIKLFSKRWVSRAWVIQEVALARKLLMVTGDASCAMDANLMSRIRGRAKISRLQVPGPLAWDPLASAPSRDLLTLLLISRHCDSTDPRDKIYSLLGLVGERLQSLITIDYSQSVEEVLTRTAAAIIVCQEDFEILAYASLSLGSRHTEKGLPTWVPDWTEHFGDMTLRPQFQRSKIGPWRSLEKLSGSSSCAKELAEMDWGAAVHIPSKWPIDLSRSPSITVRAHCLATIDNTTQEGYGERSRWQDAQAFGRDLMALIGDDVSQSDIDPRAWPAQYNWLLDPSYTRSISSIVQSNGFSAMETPQHIYRTAVQQLCAELETRGEEKYIFRAGMLPAITSHEFAEGDTVWAVDGCAVPLILRRRGVESYRIVGNCYLFALSHLDCWSTSGTGLDQRWDFDPFRHMDALGTQRIKIF